MMVSLPNLVIDSVASGNKETCIPTHDEQRGEGTDNGWYQPWGVLVNEGDGSVEAIS